MTRQIRSFAAWVALGILLAVARPAVAYTHQYVSDWTLMSRAELIVVGGIKDGSLHDINQQSPDGKQTWKEHDATLVVHRVIKGKCDEKEIPIIIFDGLTVGSDVTITEMRGSRQDPMAILKGRPKDAIFVANNGGDDQGQVLVGDARQDNIWMLRRLSGQWGDKPAGGDYGIRDLDDLQPLALEDYFKCILADDPEAAVRKQLEKQPEAVARAVAFLNHCAIQRIVKDSDPGRRVQMLLPYLYNQETYFEAWQGVLDVGNVAAPYLLAAYESAGGTSAGVWLSTRDFYLRRDIIQIWGQWKWEPAAPVLVELLKSNDQYWAGQDLTRDWSKDTGNRDWAARTQCYSELCYTVAALGKIGDPIARDAVQLTKTRWETAKMESNPIIDNCNAALAALTQPAP